MFNRDGSFPINLRGHVPLLREHQPHEQPQDNLWGLANTWEESWVFGELIFFPCWFSVFVFFLAVSHGLVLWPGIWSMAPAVVHWVLTTGLPGKCLPLTFWLTQRRAVFRNLRFTSYKGEQMRIMGTAEICKRVNVFLKFLNLKQL